MSPAMAGEGSFSAEPVMLDFEALLFDMDGTIIDSTDAIVKHWHDLGNQLGVDPDLILATSHGRRSIDTLQLYNPELANWEYVKKVEGRIPYEFGRDAVVVPGSRELLNQLDDVNAPWMIVTSGTRPLVDGWIEVMKMAEPKDLVTAEDVEQGKPDPSCYLLGAKKLGLSSGSKALVLEDSPSGVRAGKAAGFTVVAVATTHKIEQLRAAGADHIVKDLASVTLEQYDKPSKVVKIRISNALVQ